MGVIGWTNPIPVHDVRLEWRPGSPGYLPTHPGYDGEWRSYCSFCASSPSEWTTKSQALRSGETHCSHARLDPGPGATQPRTISTDLAATVHDARAALEEFREHCAESDRQLEWSNYANWWFRNRGCAVGDVYTFMAYACAMMQRRALTPPTEEV